MAPPTAVPSYQHIPSPISSSSYRVHGPASQPKGAHRLRTDEVPDAGNSSWEGQAETVRTGGSGTRLLYHRFSKSSVQKLTISTSAIAGQVPPTSSTHLLRKHQDGAIEEFAETRVRGRTTRAIWLVQGIPPLGDHEKFPIGLGECAGSGPVVLCVSLGSTRP